MVIGDCILRGTEMLRASCVDNPALDARVLMCHVLGKSDVYVMVNRDVDVEESEAEYFRLISRRCSQEPIAYIINKKEFMSMELYVDENVLIPRPDTEHLAELAIELIEKNGYTAAADFCTGSGALAISIGKNSNARVTGYDISAPALEVANKNKALLSADNVEFHVLDVLTQLGDICDKYDIAVSNPPYVTAEEMMSLDKTVDKYEPHLALYGGEDGLTFYRVLAANAPLFLKSGGVLAFEVGYTQAAAVSQLMEANFESIQIKKDYAGIERVVYGVLKG